YLSSKSEKEVELKKISEEREELRDHRVAEEHELHELYMKNGWSEELAKKMVKEASAKPELFLNEMALHELKIIPDNLAEPLQNGFIMGISYIIGGAIPLVPYLLFPVPIALLISIPLTMVGIFVLGVLTTKFTGRAWWKAGFEMFLLAGAAALVGYGVGHIADVILTNGRT
ncbi:MAG: VIT1/CCC1 transporter family protein, partial [Patescibacteria group bacterium]